MFAKTLSTFSNLFPIKHRLTKKATTRDRARSSKNVFYPSLKRKKLTKKLLYKPNKSDPFKDNIELFSNVQYSKVKDFPIWWSGFFITDYSRDNYDNVNPRGILLQEQMLRASRIINGFTTLDVTANYSEFDKAIEYEEDFDSFIVATAPDSFITLQSATQRSPTLRYPKEITQQEIQATRDKNFSKHFTILALQSDPKNIGLFVNCTPEQFVNKIFYNLEFNIIVNYYKKKNIPVTIHIFNIENNNCVTLQNNIASILDKLEIEQLTHTQLASELSKSIRDINCYHLLEVVQYAKRRIQELVDYKYPNELTANKIYNIDDDSTRNNEFKRFINETIQPITEVLNNEPCHSHSHITTFKIFIDKIYELLGMEDPTSEVAWVDTILNLKNKIKTLLKLVVIFHNYIYQYFFENDYTCFTLYNKIKELITELNDDSPDYNDPLLNKKTSQLEEIYVTLLEEKTKNCLAIQQTLLEKLEKLKKDEKALFKFKCFTCANLIDCANSVAAPEFAV
jgi:hypothetical protein